MVRHLSVICLLLVLLSTSATGPPTLQVFGDSTQVQVFPYLAKYFPDAIDSSVGGTRSDMLLYGDDGKNAAWPWSVRATAVLINHGMNDARPWDKVSIATYKRNLLKLAHAPAKVILQTPNPSLVEGRDTTPYAQAMRQVGAEMGLPVIDVHACFMRQPNWRDRLPDGVHPDEQGRQFIADVCIAPALASLLQ